MQCSSSGVQVRVTEGAFTYPQASTCLSAQNQKLYSWACQKHTWKFFFFWVILMYRSGSNHQTIGNHKCTLKKKKKEREKTKRKEIAKQRLHRQPLNLIRGIANQYGKTGNWQSITVKRPTLWIQISALLCDLHQIKSPLWT